MQIYLYPIALVFGLAVFATNRAEAGVYAFADTNGVVHFTNKLDDPRYEKMTPVPYPTWPVRSTGLAKPADIAHYNKLVEKAAREHQVEQALLQAVISVESGYNPNAVSNKGAVGLMQLMPETARRYGVTNLYDPAQNIQGGARYLRDLMQKFNNDLSLTLAAYNAGETAIAQYGNRVPPYLETLAYVPKVMDVYRRYKPVAR